MTALTWGCANRCSRWSRCPEDRFGWWMPLCRLEVVVGWKVGGEKKTRPKNSWLVTNYLHFCWLSLIKLQCKSSYFIKTTIKVWVRRSWLCPCISVVPEAKHEVSQGPFKGAVSAPNALQVSETDTRELWGGTEGINFSLTRCHWFTLKAIHWLFITRTSSCLLRGSWFALVNKVLFTKRKVKKLC